MSHNAPAPPSASSGDLPDVRSLQRSSSNLSQATILVGSESGGDDNVERSTGGAVAARPGNVEWLHGDGARNEAGVDAGAERRPTVVVRRTRLANGVSFCEVVPNGGAPQGERSELSRMVQEAERLTALGILEEVDRLYRRILGGRQQGEWV